MKKAPFLAFVLVLVLCLGLFTTVPAMAITLSFEPVGQNVSLGDSAMVGVVISGLGEYSIPSLGEFDLDVTYDPAILGFDDAVFGDQLDIWGIGSNPQVASLNSRGSVNIFELSLDTSYDLEDYQHPFFTLATLTFDTLALGTSPLTISVNVLGDALGDPLEYTTASGSISVVPEPATLLLLGCGLGGLGLLGKKRRALIS